MNQKNGKNSLGIDICFEDLDNPIELFKKWFSKAEETEINDPNAVAVATSSKDNQPNVRMVLLKGLSDKGFVFYTNFNSRKGSELKENQKDTDNLPEYEILDEILKGLVEREISVEKIISKGFERKIVEKTAQLLARSEYKRFQAAPGPKVTSKAFGRDRRFPLTSGFRNWN